MKSYMRSAFLCCSLTLAHAQGGCFQESESHLHELDHFIPAHWPSGMGDAAQKLRLRLDRIDKADGRPSARVVNQITDLVEWAPEIAADTDMPEADWLPIYEQCESLRKRLAKSGVDIGELRPEIEALADRLAQASQVLEQAAEEQLETYD